MVRTPVAVVLIALLASAGEAEAQLPDFTGFATAHIGVAAARDVRDATVAPGVSLAVLDENGVGAEVDLAHLSDFDNRLFADSSVTSLMLNFVAMYPHHTLRPFAVVGAGVMRARTAVFAGQPATAHTEAGWSAGGGLLYMLNEVFGARADARYFSYFQQHPGLPLGGDGVLDFWRLSAGATFSWPVR